MNDGQLELMVHHHDIKFTYIPCIACIMHDFMINPKIKVEIFLDFIGESMTIKFITAYEKLNRTMKIHVAIGYGFMII